MKRSLVLLLAIACTAAFATAGQARTSSTAPAPRSGELHAAKECSQYAGLPGSFCTITSSSLGRIHAGSKVFYAEAAGASALDSDVYLYAGAGNTAFGHVSLAFATQTGTITFSGGTGRFEGFHAHLAVTYDAATDLWHWDGSYRFAARHGSR
jgi:hypothetical protein